MIKEFKEFALKGNILDLAIAVIIGGVFGKIVSSLVEDVMMPLIGLIFNQPDFSGIVLFGAVKLGLFINAIVNFLIVAFVLFLVVKAMNKAKEKMEKPKVEVVEEPTTKECDFCKTEIHIDATRCPHCTSELK
ncbi:MAG: large conductance mechanosensitive channel protein MscL [Tissierellia bacterium]|nr:large conductance mechanosensitive channel protein MscL [Tissierellia bacterium]